jgi:hypothetical protein
VSGVAGGDPTTLEVSTRTFEEQADVLAGLGLAEDAEAFRATLESARPDGSPQRSVLTVSRELVPVAESAARVRRQDRPMVLGHLEPEDLATFVPIEAVEIPTAPAYLAVDVDLGARSRNVRPRGRPG